MMMMCTETPMIKMILMITFKCLLISARSVMVSTFTNCQLFKIVKTWWKHGVRKIKLLLLRNFTCGMHLCQGSLKGESVVAAILLSRMEQSYCTSGFFRFQARFLTSSAPILTITHYCVLCFTQRVTLRTSHGNINVPRLKLSDNGFSSNQGNW